MVSGNQDAIECGVFITCRRIPVASKEFSVLHFQELNPEMLEIGNDGSLI